MDCRQQRNPNAHRGRGCSFGPGVPSGQPGVHALQMPEQPLNGDRETTHVSGSCLVKVSHQPCFCTKHVVLMSFRPHISSTLKRSLARDVTNPTLGTPAACPMSTAGPDLKPGHGDQCHALSTLLTGRQKQQKIPQSWGPGARSVQDANEPGRAEAAGWAPGPGSVCLLPTRS